MSGRHRAETRANDVRTPLEWALNQVTHDMARVEIGTHIERGRFENIEIQKADAKLAAAIVEAKNILRPILNIEARKALDVLLAAVPDPTYDPDDDDYWPSE